MGVYAIVCAVAGKVYIGSAIDYAKRKSQHRTDLRCGRHANVHLQRLYNKYGARALVFKRVEPVYSSENLLAREQFWLDRLFSLVPSSVVNIQRIAGSNLGRSWKMKPEGAARAAAARVGLKRSEAVRAKMSTSQKGRSKTEEQREKNRQAALRRWADPSVRNQYVKAATHRSKERSRDETGRFV